MTAFHRVKLEFVRPGPPHNQLLSPLTPYMALCGEGSPVTFHIDLEHQQLLNRLERLRYVTPEGRGGIAIPDRVREATVAELGADVGRIFGEVRTLLAEEWRAAGESGAAACGDGTHVIHLRLVLSGSELSLLPFEMAVAPQAFPGEAVELGLQSHMPVVLTREIRRTRLAPARWDRPAEPTFLLVAAAPEGLEVPLAAHVQALREAVEPWVRWPKRTGAEIGLEPGSAERVRQRLPLVKERLRVLPNATLGSVYDLCSTHSFTHVHILAHGTYADVGGERRFGVALCRDGEPGRMEVVTGKRLAEALQAERKDGSNRSLPLVVTLATCDSGNLGSVLVPGGSIAHDLHAAGIPWVFASQFPLTVPGSARMAAELYPRLLRGDDPRQAIYEVRRKLHMQAQRDHDWASMVAYATVPDDFDRQVASFLERQMRRAITVALDRADNAVDEDETEAALDAAREKLDFWTSRLPEGEGFEARSSRAECFGMHGSTWKRIGLLRSRKNQEKQGRAAFEKALANYRKAMDQWMDENKFHWVATQALSLAAVLGESPEPDTFLLACKLASRDLSRSSGSPKAWAHGTLAELEMLATYHARDRAAPDVIQRVREHCEAIVDLTGEASFEVDSTRRQFRRYLDYWDRDEWHAVAEAAVKELTPRGGRGVPELPPYA